MYNLEVRVIPYRKEQGGQELTSVLYVHAITNYLCGIGGIPD